MAIVPSNPSDGGGDSNTAVLYKSFTLNTTPNVTNTVYTNECLVAQLFSGTLELYCRASLSYTMKNGMYYIPSIIVQLCLKKSSGTMLYQTTIESVEQVTFNGFSGSNPRFTYPHKKIFEMDNTWSSWNNILLLGNTENSSGFVIDSRSKKVNAGIHANNKLLHFKVIDTRYNSTEYSLYVNFNFNITAPKTQSTVVFDANGGKFSDGGTKKTYTELTGSKIIVPAATKNSSTGERYFTCTYQLNGGKINGSKEDIVYKCKYNTQTDYTQSNYTSKDTSKKPAPNASYTIEDDVTFYASWNSDERQITDAQPRTPTSQPQKFGYTFNGWDEEPKSPLKSNFITFAKYTPMTYSVVWDLNIGTLSKNLSADSSALYIIKGNSNVDQYVISNNGVRTYSDNKDKTSPFNTIVPVAFGYRFIGWGNKDKSILYAYDNNTKAFKNQFNDDIVRNNGVVPSVLTIYAHWEPILDNIYTHYYMLNGTQNYLDGKNYTYNINNKNFHILEPDSRHSNTKDDWVFLGWYEEIPRKDDPWYSKPTDSEGHEFWGNTTVAKNMGDINYAYGIFKNPDDVESVTSGKATSPLNINISEKLNNKKTRFRQTWGTIIPTDQKDNTEYNKLNIDSDGKGNIGAWNWRWDLYGLWTITGKFIMTEPNVWSKVRSIYVLTQNSNGEKVWKYVQDLWVCKGKSGMNPQWAHEIIR